MQSLTVRLEMVFGQVKAAASGSGEVRVIDVGSDHGYLALRCLEEGIAQNAVCTEIHEGPARKSQAALKGAGYSDVSEVHVTDGLIGVPLKDNDIVVIAGMGGLNIIDIISQAIKDNGTDVSFDKQSQKDLIAWIGRHFAAEKKQISPELCAYLIEITDGTMTVLSGEIMSLFDKIINRQRA